MRSPVATEAPQPDFSDDAMRRLSLGDGEQVINPDATGKATNPPGFIDYGNGNTSTAAQRARAAAKLAKMPSWPDTHDSAMTGHMLTLRLEDPKRAGNPRFALHDVADTARFHGHLGPHPALTLPTQQLPHTAETTIIRMPRSHRREGMRTKLSRLILHGGYRSRHAARK